MIKREIILADTDSEIRGEMADTFRRNGYQVETTDSASHVICTVLEKHVPVVLLGSDFDKKIALHELVRLLKNCNRHLTIILVSNEESLPRIRSIRQEGIYYHALKPDNREQVEEICLAIECAFSKHDQHAVTDDDAAIRAEASAPRDEITAIREETSAPRDDVTAIREESSRQGKEKKMKTRTKVIGTTAAILGIAVIAAVAAPVEGDTSEFAMWGFLGFCALIIVGQLLPAFFGFRTARDVAAQHAREAVQEARAVSKVE